MKDFDFYRAKYIRDGKWQIEFFDKNEKYIGSIYKVGSKRPWLQNNFIKLGFL